MRLLEGEIPPLQNDDWFLSSSYLKGTLCHYKMKIGFYMLLSSGYLKGTLQYYKIKIGFYHQVTWRGHSTTINEDWFLYVFIIRLLEGNTSEGQLPLLQNEIGFYMLSSDGQILLLQNDFRSLKVFQLPKRWQLIKCNSQAAGTKCLAHPHFFILI